MRARSGRREAAARGRAQPNCQRKNLISKSCGREIKALVAPRKGLLIAGMALMAVNRVAGLVLPYTSKTLLDKVLSPTNPHPELLPRSLRWFSRP